MQQPSTMPAINRRDTGAISITAVATVTITTPGVLPAGTTPPANPVAQLSTNGAGTGATFNLTWGYIVPGPQLYACDWMQEPFTLSTYVNPTATATFGMQYTLDDIINTPPANVRWIADTAIPAGTTTAKTATYGTGSGNFLGPITGLLLTITALTGPVEWKILQS